MRTARTLAAAALAASALVAVGATTQTADAAEGSKDLVVQYGGKVMKNEKFYTSGQLTKHIERQVKLQYKSGSSWKTVETATSNPSTGRFYFDAVSTGSSRTYRYYASATEGASKVTGHSTKVTVVSQKVTIFEIDNARQCQFFGPPENFDDMTVLAKFYPARPGRNVSLLTEKYGSQSRSQDSRGVVSYVIHPGTTKQDSATSVRAGSYNGASSKGSSTITTKLTTCTLIIL